MDYKEFAKSTVNTLRSDMYEQIKTVLIPEYLSFSVISEDEITLGMLSEKLCDYFEKLELKTGKSFDKYVELYLKDIDSIVERRIEKTPQPKKNDSTPVVVPRARKYYEKAVSLKKTRVLSTGHLIDYTRIMLCLYTAIIKNEFKEIGNFDFSSDCLNPIDIIDAMKNEQESVAVKIGKKQRFDIKNLYCSDTCTFILTIVLAYKILNDRVQEEAEHE